MVNDSLPIYCSSVYGKKKGKAFALPTDSLDAEDDF